MSYDLPSCDVSQQFYDEKLIKAAREQHKCCECRKPIEKGESYYRCTGKWDGYLWSGCQHVYCWLFARSLNGHDSTAFRAWSDRYQPTLLQGGGLNAWGFEGGGCVPFEGVSEFLEECDPRDWDQDEELGGEWECNGLTHSPRRFWEAMQSGCRENFFQGAGI